MPTTDDLAEILSALIGEEKVRLPPKWIKQVLELERENQQDDDRRTAIQGLKLLIDELGTTPEAN